MTRSIRPAGLIGESETFRDMLAAIGKIALYDATVLIGGETGSVIGVSPWLCRHHSANAISNAWG